MSEIITKLPPEYVREFWDDLTGRIPEEKAQVELRQTSIARVMQAVGSVQMEGLGQKVAEIDSRLYFRMMHESGGDADWIHGYLKDNPQLCAPGYKPRGPKTDLRHGLTFVGGKPVR